MSLWVKAEAFWKHFDIGFLVEVLLTFEGEGLLEDILDGDLSVDHVSRDGAQTTLGGHGGQTGQTHLQGGGQNHLVTTLGDLLKLHRHITLTLGQIKVHPIVYNTFS